MSPVLPVSGSIFGSLIDARLGPIHIGGRTELHYHTGRVVNISKLVLISGEGKASPAPPRSRPPEPTEPETVEPMPCRVETKLVFADKRIRDFRELALGEISLFVVLCEQGQSHRISLGSRYPGFSLRANPGGSKVEILEHEPWQRPESRIRFEKPKSFNGKPICLSNAWSASQVTDSDGHSVTLYRVPLHAEFCLAGQLCFFSKEVFGSLFVIALRSCRDNVTRLRKLALVAVPLPLEKR